MYVYVCACICRWVYPTTCTFTNVYLYTQAPMHLCIQAFFTYKRIYAYTHVRMQMCQHMHKNTNTGIHVHTHTWIQIFTTAEISCTFWSQSPFSCVRETKRWHQKSWCSNLFQSRAPQWMGGTHIHTCTHLMHTRTHTYKHLCMTKHLCTHTRWGTTISSLTKIFPAK